MADETKKTSNETVVAISTTICDYFQKAQEDLRHSCDSHEASRYGGQCEVLEKLLSEVHHLVTESADGEVLMNQIREHEDKVKRYEEKARLIVKASDWNLEYGYEEDDELIKEFIEKLEQNGIEVSKENFDAVSQYVQEKLNMKGENILS